MFALLQMVTGVHFNSNINTRESEESADPCGIIIREKRS